jgi:hypothetical protein
MSLENAKQLYTRTLLDSRDSRQGLKQYARDMLEIIDVLMNTVIKEDFTIITSMLILGLEFASYDRVLWINSVDPNYEIQVTDRNHNELYVQAGITKSGLLPALLKMINTFSE